MLGPVLGVQTRWTDYWGPRTGDIRSGVFASRRQRARLEAPSPDRPSAASLLSRAVLADDLADPTLGDGQAVDQVIDCLAPPGRA
jgi:hypothetical protein